MTRVSHNKLVRDRIPEIIREDGDTAVIRTLRSGEYRKELLRKLVEEAKEVQGAKKRGELLAELADVEEVLAAIRIAARIDKKEVEQIRKEKSKKRGAFQERILLVSVS